MNLCILIIAAKIIRCVRKHLALKCIAAALIGSTAETIIFFTLQNEMLFLLLSHFAVIPLMAFVAFGWNSLRIFFQNGLICYGVALILGGLTEAVENTFQIHNLQFLTGVFMTIFTDKVFRKAIQGYKKRHNYLEVELKNRGKTERGMGLLDSGNLLAGPDRKTGVHFLDEKLWDSMNIEEDQFVGTVKYRTINSSGNIARIYEIDELTVFKKSIRLIKTKPLVAKAERRLYANKRYNIILSSQLEEEMEEYENKSN